jgi:hypothetical protein
MVASRLRPRAVVEPTAVEGTGKTGLELRPAAREASGNEGLFHKTGIRKEKSESPQAARIYGPHRLIPGYNRSMSRNMEEIFKEALALPIEARAALVAPLLESLDTEVDEDREEAWLREIQRWGAPEIASTALSSSVWKPSAAAVSYLIVYRDKAESIEIVAVAHGRRRPGYWRPRTFL